VVEDKTEKTWKQSLTIFT
jgi:glycerol-3-phosphate dehydrogenase